MTRIGILGCWIPASAFLIGFFAWLTHVFVCLQTASYILLIAGAIFFPIGIIHGIAIWLGFM